MLEVCIDSLESAVNAVQGGADELEVCGALSEGGLTPSPGLVKEITKLVNKTNKLNQKPKINIMIRCRGGSDFNYSDHEMSTMLSDIEIYKNMRVDRFVFGALTNDQHIDKINCNKVIEKASPVPVTFHRAFDVVKDPKLAIKDIVELGFTRLLTSGMRQSAAEVDALKLIQYLIENYGDQLEIMPGAGINNHNAVKFKSIGCKIVHSSCKIVKRLPDVGKINMGSNEVYVTDVDIVKEVKNCLR